MTSTILTDRPGSRSGGQPQQSQQSQTLATDQSNEHFSTTTTFINGATGVSQHKKQSSLEAPPFLRRPSKDDTGSPTREKGHKPRTSGQARVCGKCGQQINGQFVRALGDTYHLECFTCQVRLHRS